MCGRGSGWTAVRALLAWTHSSNDWYADVSYESYSRDFRAWNGFVTQVGFVLHGCRRSVLLPRQRRIRSRGSARGDDSRGRQRRRTDQPMDRSGLCHPRRGRHATYRSLGTHSRRSTLAGPATYDLFVLSISSTPFAWMPQAIAVSTSEVIRRTCHGRGRRRLQCRG